MGVSKSARTEYQHVIHEYAREGWRLVQVFAPGMGVYGAAKYFELIFEREVAVYSGLSLRVAAFGP